MKEGLLMTVSSLTLVLVQRRYVENLYQSHVAEEKVTLKVGMLNG
jgi:hypothetical protein